MLKPDKFDSLSQISHWRSIAPPSPPKKQKKQKNKQKNPKNDRDLNQCVLHLWSKFSDISLNGWWMSYGTDKLKMG